MCACVKYPMCSQLVDFFFPKKEEENGNTLEIMGVEQ